MAWNWLDFILILQGLMELCSMGQGAHSNSFLRTLRLLRVAKVLRIFRVIKFFTQLHLIITALVGSVMHLVWSMLVFAILFFIFSLYLCSGVATYLDSDDGVDSKESDALLMSFGSVQSSFLSLYMTVTGGSDWSDYFDAMAPTSLQPAFLFFVAFSQIALLNIVTGIFVDNAMKVAQPDIQQQAEEQFADEQNYAIELEKLFESYNDNKDGVLQRDEFESMVREGKLTNYFFFLNIDTSWTKKNLPLLYDAVSDDCLEEGLDGDGVPIGALVERIMALRGYARGTEIMDLYDRVSDMHALVEQIASSENVARIGTGSIDVDRQRRRR